MKECTKWKKFVKKVLPYIGVGVGAAALAVFVTLLIVFKNRSKLDELESIIDAYFIDEYDKTAVEDAAAAAMVDALGNPWSYYIPASQYQAHTERQENAYVGIGITISPREDGLGFDIVKVEPGSGAEAAGVQSGDVLIRVEGQSVVSLGTDGTASLIRGDAGTKANVTVLRGTEGSVGNYELLCFLDGSLTEEQGKAITEEIAKHENVSSAVFVSNREVLDRFVEDTGAEEEAFSGVEAEDMRHRVVILLKNWNQAEQTATELESLTGVLETRYGDIAETEHTFAVERKTIQTVVASGTMLEGNIGYITIENFNARSASETIAAVESLRSQGATALIFDVRNNPGGYKDEMVQVLDYLLPEGDLFRSVDYSGAEETDTSDAKCLEMPMVVLLNGNSYSAAEFFAAALHEYDWAAVVGEPSTGKSHFQVTIELRDGSAVNLSIGKYFTPKGVSLADVGGLQPDVLVDVDEETEKAIYLGTLSPEEDPQVQAAAEVLKNGK